MRRRPDTTTPPTGCEPPGCGFVCRRPHHVSLSVSGSAHATGTISLTGEAFAASPWSTSAPVDERLEWLRQKLTELEDYARQNFANLGREIQELRQRINEVQARFASEHADLVTRLKEAQSRQVRFDGKGLVVAGLGIFLSATSVELHNWLWTWLEFGVIGASGVITGWLATWARKDHREAQKGSASPS
jgi:hypothetical protein